MRIGSLSGERDSVRHPDCSTTSELTDSRQVPAPLARYIGAALVFALSCGMFLLSTRVIQDAPAWRTFEFCQYAEIGQNLASQGKFSTRLIEPMALAYIDRHRPRASATQWPVIDRYPLPCVIIAGLMVVLGPTALAAACSNGLAMGLLAALTYLLAQRWFGTGWAALVALLFLTNPAFYGYFVLLGTPDIWFALIFVGELLVWAHLLDAPPWRVGWAVSLGALAGLAYLTRFNVLLFVIIQGAVLLAQRRWRETLAAATAALLVVLPLLWFNWQQLHRPIVTIYSTWNLLDGIGAYHTEPWLYYQVPDLASALLAHPAGVVLKFLTNLFLVVPIRIWSLWHLLVLIPLAWAGLALVRPAPEVRRFWVWSAGLFLVQLVAFSVLRLELEDRHSPFHGRYFFWFASPALLMGVGMLRQLARPCGWRLVLAATAVAAQVGVFGQTWWGWLGHDRTETNLGGDPIRRALAEIIPGDCLVASNQPQILTWYCKLKSVSLPADPEELDRLNRQSPTPVDFIFLDLNFNCIRLDRRWSLLVSPASGTSSAWESHLRRDYDYVLPPERTRPLGYVLLRRRDSSWPGSGVRFSVLPFAGMNSDWHFQAGQN